MTRVLLDTNIIVSALLFPVLLLIECCAWLCRSTTWYSPTPILRELHEGVLRKRPDLLADLEDLLAQIDQEIAPAGTSHMSIADRA